MRLHYPLALLCILTPLLLALTGNTALAQQEDWCLTEMEEPPPVVPEDFQPDWSLPSIPVVFHVITGRDENGNMVGHVADSTIQDQIDVLNQAYTGTNISFSLLGVGRLEHEGWFAVVNEDYRTAARHLYVDPSHVLNVYVGRDAGGLHITAVHGAPEDGINIGYTTFPGSIVSDYNQGDVAVHEVGHYFSLRHTWGPIGVIQRECDGDIDDGFPDTGLHYRPNYGCPRHDPPNSCVDVDYHIDLPDPIFNYMNYTDDDCKDEFTPQQIAAQMYVREGRRNELGLLIPTVYDSRSAPVTFDNHTFSGEQIYVLPGADVTITNKLTLTNGARFVVVGGADLSGVTDVDLQGGSLFDVRRSGASLAFSDVTIQGGSRVELGRELILDPEEEEEEDFLRSSTFPVDTPPARCCREPHRLRLRLGAFYW